MNKKELLNQMAMEAGVTKTQAEQLLDAFIVAIDDITSKGGSLQVSGLGTIMVSKTPKGRTQVDMKVKGRTSRSTAQKRRQPLKKMRASGS